VRRRAAVLATTLAGLAQASGCVDDAPEALELPSRPSPDQRTCSLQLEDPDPAWAPSDRVLAVRFDGPHSPGAWAVVDEDGTGGAAPQIRRRPAHAFETPVEPRSVENGSVAARYRFVEDDGPGAKWLERDRLDIGPGGDQLVPFAFDLWRLDVDDPAVPVFYKPQVDQATNLQGSVANYNFRTVVLDGAPFLLAVPNQSTVAEWRSFCGGVREPELETPIQAIYLCFFPLSRHDLTLGGALEAGPVAAPAGYRFSSVEVDPISNLRSTGFAMLPIVRVIDPIAPVPGAPAISNTDLIVLKVRALQGAPVLPSHFLYALLGSDELGTPDFAPVIPVQDELHTYFGIDDRSDPRDDRMRWTSNLAFDTLPGHFVEDEVPPGAEPIQLADGVAFAWIEGDLLWLREFEATGADMLDDRLEFGEAQVAFDAFGVDHFTRAGPGHLVITDTDGYDHLARITCE